MTLFEPRGLKFKTQKNFLRSGSGQVVSNIQVCYYVKKGDIENWSLKQMILTQYFSCSHS